MKHKFSSGYFLSVQNIPAYVSVSVIHTDGGREDQEATV